jgi:hypothetical protein
MPAIIPTVRFNAEIIFLLFPLYSPLQAIILPFLSCHEEGPNDINQAQKISTKNEISPRQLIRFD